MKKLLTTPLFLLFVIALLAQDTIVVQTLTFDSITTRRGTWQFPEGQEFRKILMHHTLKCDAMTQHDQYPCGEWDYLTYNKIYDHTGQYDSTLYFHPNYTLVNNDAPDSLLLTDTPNYSYHRHIHQSVSFPDTLLLEQYELGSTSEYAYDVLQTDHYSGRSQFLWKAEEMAGQGMTAGQITGLKLNVLKLSANEVNHLMIRLKQVELDELSPDTLILDMDTVFYDESSFGIGWQDFNFFDPFDWDGQSDIVVDFSFTGKQNDDETGFWGEDPGFDCGIIASSDGYALDLDGNTDFYSLPADTYFNSDFTFECWFLKRSNNNWSRIFDFGNGPNEQNVIVVLSKQESGKLSFHVNKDSENRSFELDDPTPLNEWTHLTLRLTDHLAWVYINGNFVELGLLQTPQDIERTINFIGRSNWENDKFADVLLDEFRIYKTALEPEEIRAHYRKSLENPQTDTNLIVYYDFNEGTGNIIHDLSSEGHDAEGFGLPGWHRIQGHEINLDFEQYNIRPNIIFERLESSQVQTEEILVLDSVENSPTQIVLYEDLENPTVPTDTIIKYIAGYQYVYHNWQKVDSVWVEPQEILYKQENPYYGEPFEILEEYEIGRFITPYGIGLDLGPEGFTWIYDVTDYALLLQGEVDLSAGNQQELIDLKFEFITGTPPREVKQIDRIWGKYKSYYYKNLDDDTSLSAKTLPLLPEASQFRVKTRITGHGHQSNNGEYPHCCEWKDNEHFLLIDGQQVGSWHIFQYNECALNPVFPQGGTWPGAREGWCPGDLVKVFDFEIGEYITGNDVTLDYDITPVPDNNQGMGNGNYVIAMHLIHYGDNSFDTDAEVFDVISPNSYEYYSRKNPLCVDPAILIRNNGSSDLQSLKLTYGVSGGVDYEYDWSGNIPPHHIDTVYLPLPGNSFWIGNGQNIFTITLSEPNGSTDQYPDNDSYSTLFEMPDLIDDAFFCYLKTNNQAYRYSLTVKDMEGNIFLNRDNLENNAEYQDTLNLPDGCYTLELLDEENMGLSYWAYPQQGSGYFRLFNMDSTVLKTFISEFGRKIFYTFHVGDASYIKETVFEPGFRVYPNPFNENLSIEVTGAPGELTIILYSLMGEEVQRYSQYSHGNEMVRLNTSGILPGIYMLRVLNAGIFVGTEKIVKN